MTSKPWLVFGAFGVGSLIAIGCDSGEESNMTTGPTGAVTSATTGASTTAGTGTGTTGATGTSSTGTTGATGTTSATSPTTATATTATSSASSSSGTAGATSVATTAASTTTTGGAPVDAPSCEEIPSRASSTSFTVSSTEFAHCMPMPEATTCNGKLFAAGASPAITWTAGPEGTMSYAMTFTDLTILTTRDPADNELYNQGYHYVIWDIPATSQGLPANMGSGFQPPEVPGAKQWSPFNDYGYMGPCPNMPPMDGVEPPPLNNDTYSFTLYAMPLATLPIPAVVEGGPSFPRVMDDYLKANALAAAEYRGTSNAQATSTDGVLPPMFEVPCPTEGEQPENCLGAE